MGLWSYCTARHGARHYGRENTFVAITILLLLSLLAPATSPALAADAPGTATAPVVVDGATLFRVRGLSAYPADERASVIADRVRAAAADRGAAIDTLRVVPGEHHRRDRLRGPVAPGRGDAAPGGQPHSRPTGGAVPLPVADVARRLFRQLRAQRVLRRLARHGGALHRAPPEHPGRVQRIRRADHDAGL